MANPTVGKLTDVAVGVSAVALPAAALANRQSVRITNPPANTQSIWIGYANTVTTGNPVGGGTQGVELKPGMQAAFQVGPSVTLYGIATVAGVVVQVEEVA